MFSARPPVITALVALTMLVAVYGAMKALFKTSFEGSEQHTINNNSDANTIWRADTPLSLAEAEAIKKCPIPLPPQATQIQYVDFYEYGGFMHCVRFEASISVCKAHAAHLIRSFNERKQESQNSNREALPAQAQILENSVTTAMGRYAREQVERAARAPWFNPDSVAEGEMWGLSDSHTPIIVIDTAKGVFYYMRID